MNVTQAFLLSKLCIPRMVETAGGGAIVNISSRSSDMVQTAFVAYGAGKAALNMMTRNLAAEVAPKVRVNAISVGGVETDALAVVLTNDALREQFNRNTPMGRPGTVEDIAACALYLASPASAWVTGKIFQVDGGTEHPSMSVPVKAALVSLGMALQLYAHPFSSYCQKVLVALYENATPFELRMLDFGPEADERIAAEFAALWPLQRMPVLVDAGRPVMEATIIIEHLQLFHPGRVRFAPRRRARRARRADDGPLLRQLRDDADAEDRVRRDPQAGSARRAGRRRRARAARHRLSLARRQGSRAASGPRAARSASPTAPPHRRCSTPTGSIRSRASTRACATIASACSRGRRTRAPSTRRGRIARISRSGIRGGTETQPNWIQNVFPKESQRAEIAMASPRQVQCLLWDFGDTLCDELRSGVRAPNGWRSTARSMTRTGSALPGAWARSTPIRSWRSWLDA